jgi:hypothetical protein
MRSEWPGNETHRWRSACSPVTAIVSLFEASARCPERGRILVKAADGQFHELSSGYPVTVADEVEGSGECQAEVIYRIEGAGSGPSTIRALPVSYDIVVKPVM